MARAPNQRNARARFNDNYYAKKRVSRSADKETLQGMLIVSLFLTLFARNFAPAVGNKLGTKLGISLTCIFMCCISMLLELQGSQVKRRVILTKNPMVDLDDLQFEGFFRFKKCEIPTVIAALGLPEFFVDPKQRSKCTAETGFLMLLVRLHYPTKLLMLELLFGHERTVCGRLCNVILDCIYEKFSHKMQFEKQLILTHLQTYSEAISRKCGNALSQCFGFIDGTVHPVCRPVKYQKSVWSGHKRVHGMKFQSIILPDGMFGQLYGPVEARRHDVILLKESGLVSIFENSPALEGYHVFGDMGYTNNSWILSPFKGINIDGDQAKWNKLCRHVRIVVEWGFGNLQRKWAHLTFKPAMKVFLTPTSKMYITAAFLCNIHNCLHPNQVAQYFDLAPPPLEEYVQLVGHN
jgi:hypothetical protein